MLFEVASKLSMSYFQRTYTDIIKIKALFSTFYVKILKKKIKKVTNKLSQKIFISFELDENIFI
jgi:hypothetical protein